MPLTEQEVTVYECSSCGRLEANDGTTCCGQPMEALEREAVFESPEPEQVAQQIFGISPNELTVCKALVSEESSTISDLADRLPYDRSTLSRHLDHLVELGIVEKHTEGIPGGGRENVYSTVPPREIRRTLLLGLYAWTEEASGLTEGLSEAKIEAMVEEAVGAVDGSGEAVGHDDSRDDGSDDTNRDSDAESLMERLFGRI